MKIKTLLLLVFLMFSAACICAEEITFQILGWKVSGELESTPDGFIARNVCFDDRSIGRSYGLTFKEIKLDKRMLPTEDAETENVNRRDLHTCNHFKIKMKKAVLKASGRFGPGIYIQGLLIPNSQFYTGNVYMENEEADFYIDPDRNVFTEKKHNAAVHLGYYWFTAESMQIRKVTGSGKNWMVLENLSLIQDQPDGFVIPLLVLDGLGTFLRSTLPEKTIVPLDKDYLLKNADIDMTESYLSISGWLFFQQNTGQESIPSGMLYWQNRKQANCSTSSFSNGLELRFCAEEPLRRGSISLASYKKTEFKFSDYDQEFGFSSDKIKLAISGRTELKNAESFDLFDKTYHPEELGFAKNHVLLYGSMGSEKSTDGPWFELSYNTLGYIEYINETSPAYKKNIYSADNGSVHALTDALIRKDTNYLDSWFSDAKQPYNLEINGFPLLIHRVLEGDHWAVKWLTDKGLDPNVKFKEKPAIIHAIESGNTETVKTLLESGVDIVHYDGSINPLFIALQKFPECAKILLQYKCDVSSPAPGNPDATLFDMLIKDLDAELIKQGLAQGIAPFISGIYQHPFEKMISKVKPDIKLLDLLSSAGLSPLDAGEANVPVLYTAVRKGSEDYCILLAKHLTAAELKRSVMYPVLCEAVAARYYNLADILISSEVPLSGFWTSGESLFTLLEKSGNAELLKKALANGLQNKPWKKKNVFLSNSDKTYSMQIEDLDYDNESDTYLGLFSRKEEIYSSITNMQISELSDGKMTVIGTPGNAIPGGGPYFKKLRNGFLVSAQVQDGTILSGIDVSVDLLDSEANSINLNILYTKNDENLLQMYIPETGNTDSGFVTLKSFVDNNDKIFIVPLDKNENYNIPHTLGTSYNGKIIDSHAIKTSSGYIVCTLCTENDSCFISIKSLSEHNLVIDEFMTETDPSSIIRTVKDNSGKVYFAVYSGLKQSLCFFEITEDFSIRKLWEMSCPVLNDFSLLNKNGQLLVACRKKHKKDSNQLAGLMMSICSFECIPEYCFTLDSSNQPEKLVLVLTGNGELGIASSYLYGKSMYLAFFNLSDSRVGMPGYISFPVVIH